LDDLAICGWELEFFIALLKLVGAWIVFKFLDEEVFWTIPMLLDGGFWMYDWTLAPFLLRIFAVLLLEVRIFLSDVAVAYLGCYLVLNSLECLATLLRTLCVAIALVLVLLTYAPCGVCLLLG
jgi:hypothetical protein